MENHGHFPRVLLAGLHRFSKLCRLGPTFLATLELEIHLLEHNGVFEDDLKSILEILCEDISGEVLGRGFSGQSR